MADMDVIDAVLTAENAPNPETDAEIAAWQKLVDTGLAWSLQGWFGRNAVRLIEAGLIHRQGIA